jgi:uncharacterized protein (DUF1501 family)
MKTCHYACRSAEHIVSRRIFLGASAIGVSGLFGGMTASAAMKQLTSQQKRVAIIFLSGGSSQLETWDPKPATETGGPFRAIPTSVTGTHICELLPHTAKQMHRLALIRGLNTKAPDHGKGRIIMLTGRNPEPAIEYPELGAAAAKLLGREGEGVGDGLPGHIQITPNGSSEFSKRDAAFLGPKYASVLLANGKPPADLLRPPALTSEADRQREALRQKLNERFARSRKSAQTEAYTESYDQAAQFLQKQEVLDVEKEDAKVRDRYGKHDFGRHLLLARRLLEAGVTCVKVTHSNYDTHHENFDFHIEQLGEFDHPFATFIDDLAERGLLQSTLVIVMAEMGRTPKINDRYGRDHWGAAWSVCLGGAGVKGGALVGKTNANGTAVVDREVNGGHLFHTYYRALGLDSTKNFYPNQRPVPMADPKAEAIEEILV